MGRDSGVFVGLDLGTKKIAVAVAERALDDPDDAQIFCIGEAPARGMRKGMIVNLEQAVTSVSDAIADAESMLGGVKISTAVVAFSGHDVKSSVLHGMISLGRSARAILPEDLERVIETALSTIELQPSSCFIHTIPIKYAIDGNGGIENPLDMTGTRLEVELLALAIPTSVAQNVVNCVEKAGVKVSGLVLKSVAEALGTLNADERAIGASLVSIGGGTTGLAVFSDGHLIHAGEIPVGGDHITNDLSCVLKIPFAAAEEQKKVLDIDPTKPTVGKIFIENRGHKIDIDKSEMIDIVGSRLDELFADSVVPLLKAPGGGEIAYDVVLSGGVMRTLGILKFAQEYLDSSARIGTPVLSDHMPRERRDCRYSAVAGIIVYLLEKRKNPFSYIDAPMSIFRSSSAKTPKTIKSPKRPSQSFTKSFMRGAREIIKQLF